MGVTAVGDDPVDTTLILDEMAEVLGELIVEWEDRQLPLMCIRDSLYVLSKYEAKYGKNARRGINRTED